MKWMSNFLSAHGASMWFAMQRAQGKTLAKIRRFSTLVESDDSAQGTLFVMLTSSLQNSFLTGVRSQMPCARFLHISYLLKMKAVLKIKKT